MYVKTANKCISKLQILNPFNHKRSYLPMICDSNVNVMWPS